MSLKEKTNKHEKVSSERPASRPTVQNEDALTRHQLHPAVVLQRAMLAPHSLTPSEVLQLQRAVGNRAVIQLLTGATQPAGFNSSSPVVQRKPTTPATPGEAVTPDVGPPPAWDALQGEFERQMQLLLTINSSAALTGERTDLITELSTLWAQIGAPGEKNAAELDGLRAKLRAFEKARAAERALALENWLIIEEEYQIERRRLAGSQERSDRIALEYLDTIYQRAKRRKETAGQYLRFDDISALGAEMAAEKHLQKGWEAALHETIESTPEGKNDKHLKSWPWPQFKAAQLAIESGAKTPHEMSYLRQVMRQQLDSAIRYQIRHAVGTMLELGESKTAADAWARAAHARASQAADQLASKVPLTGHGAHKWTHRLHIAGRLTVYIDIGASLIDIFTSPPKEMPKKSIVQASRIVVGLAGIGPGVRIGARLGRIAGPKGAAVGGFIGGVVGGFVGAWTAKKVAAFITDEIWPPEDTYIDTVQN